MDYSEAGGLRIAKPLYEFVNAEAIPGTGVDPPAFWAGLRARCSRELAPRNKALLAKRDAMQAQIDAWHLRHRGKPFDQAAYQAFLREHRLPGARAGGFRRRAPTMSIPRSPRSPGRSSSCR